MIISAARNPREEIAMQSVMEGRVKMREVKVRTERLLEILRENREKHVTDYNRSVLAYREAAVEVPSSRRRRRESGGW